VRDVRGEKWPLVLVLATLDREKWYRRKMTIKLSSGSTGFTV
jgi:hypothetical protein